MAKKYHGAKSTGFGNVKNQMANMPQNVVHKQYAKTSSISDRGYCDTLEELDKKNKQNVKQLNKGK